MNSDNRVTLSLSQQQRMRADLCRLSRFGANITDAHSCFIFLPAALFNSSAGSADTGPEFDTGKAGDEELDLAGAHSLSNDVIAHPKLSVQSGLIGWVARHGRSIHVSPFERDSRTLGVYSAEQNLKSFIGMPAHIAGQPFSGVVACDSKKSFAFSKLQGKLLEDLCREVSSTVELHLRCAAGSGGTVDNEWDNFVNQGRALVTGLGRAAVEVMRIHLYDYADYERTVGTEEAVRAAERLHRLIAQLLPPEIPLFRLPDGSMLCVIDRMMGAYYENRIRAVSEHAFADGRRPSGSAPVGSRNPGLLGPNIEIARVSFGDKRFRHLTLEQLFTASLEPDRTEPQTNGMVRYEYRRA